MNTKSCPRAQRNREQASRRIHRQQPHSNRATSGGRISGVVLRQGVLLHCAVGHSGQQRDDQVVRVRLPRRDLGVLQQTDLYVDITHDQERSVADREIVIDGARIVGDSALTESPWVQTPVPVPQSRCWSVSFTGSTQVCACVHSTCSEDSSGGFRPSGESCCSPSRTVL